MRAAGLDIGSRTIELAVVEDGQLVDWHIEDTGHEPNLACDRLLAGTKHDALVATGYGRALAEIAFAAPTVTEIRAHAVGARHLVESCRTVIDVGGQDTKAIGLDESGRATRFEMNDRCAAGTGRFLEVMAQALRYDLGELGEAALASGAPAKVNSMCTVFAESEVVSLLTKGVPRQEIARGLHAAIVERTYAMVSRVSVEPPIVFTGGGALNGCLRSLLEDRLGVSLVVPDNPQLVGALGAALLAQNGAKL
ncbi:MAG: 3-hydroxyacyl-ACP dehydratase [Actinobacteria bacterium]|nr:MAG: 3-hydroxyacyl-ACP dehydratase [Actinomycetota bacterium]